MERFGVALGPKEVTAPKLGPTIWGPIFDQKSKKWYPKIIKEFDVEKVSKHDAKRDAK